ncbi:predicted protein [Sclerotinia sclerotiorum 1980 UF-70]|uniref:Uncharacterized protein n=1 Tax=Sclerotinia sclerotiorum (strain ATCC 18683 / 1980 / Ss-1) TaxID=665079 RepID=A7F4P6_SCLS1|nr:predicted protein [Sclerotinia sclerotiorum 1980 UF-70]EDN97717.1 predicted protein [Sclerotinia sclerotiorum 1980 UF-70]
MTLLSLARNSSRIITVPLSLAFQDLQLDLQPERYARIP